MTCRGKMRFFWNSTMGPWIIWGLWIRNKWFIGFSARRHPRCEFDEFDEAGDWANADLSGESK